ncbi:PocR ligand-binding domain-containing protein [Clostridium sp. CX1]|uniref:PocR ligand-binding domain-containing protein n=1 Tax=Clostridium sp. CX1 TaxID=2978346 RepID=UPI0021C22A3D|nr:PocR ligand-binding domain-containing protein [Clostridium sp. CX1]MCT8978033.1 PocR ligand-binding domain-containing protein [Clostridium sp. CX1]
MYKLDNLLDMEKLQKLMDKFYNLTKVPYAILDANGNTIISSGQTRICTCFHSSNPKALMNCLRNKKAVDCNYSEGSYTEYICGNGLVEACTPIMIRGEYIGNLSFGQFLKCKPDLEYFERQADELGVNKKDYLDAVEEIPIVTEEKIKDYLDYFRCLTELMSDMAVSRLKQMATEAALQKNNEYLEYIVRSRTKELTDINKTLIRDMNKRRAVENQLRESEQKYKGLVELIPDSIYIRTREKFLYANPAGARSLGASSVDDLIGKSVSDFLEVHPDYKEKFDKKFDLIYEKGSMPLTEEKFIKKYNNELLDIETTAAIYPYDGEDSILVVSRDISERRKAEELSRDIAEKTKLLKDAIEYESLRTEFFANLSHEFRTPLNIIFTALQMCKLVISSDESMNSSKLKHYISLMYQNVYRLIRLVNNLIDITKIDSGHFDVTFGNYNIISIVEDITLSVGEYVQNKGIELIFDTDIEEKVISCDPNSIERIMLNLLSNAVKFTQEKGTIYVDIHDKGDKIVILVRDTGVGIPKEKQELIFERFVQVDKSFKRNREGSGIGLALIKSLVELHKGKMWVESEAGKGSCFYVELPAKVLDHKNQKENNIENTSKVERINIEFSDIYI